MTTRRWLMDEWRTRLQVELRLHEVPGPRIGEALAEVETHCADSGQSPDEAFGDPAAYAAALARDLVPAPRRGRRVLRAGLLAVATIGGIDSLLAGVDAMVHGVRGGLTAGQLAGAAGAALMGPALVGVFGRSGRRHPMWWPLLLVIGTPFVLTVPPLLWKQPAISAPGWGLVAVGLCLLAAVWGPISSERFLAERLADRVVDPRTGREPRALPRLPMAVLRWGGLVALAIAVVLIVLLPYPRQ